LASHAKVVYRNAERERGPILSDGAVSITSPNFSMQPGESRTRRLFERAYRASKAAGLYWA